MSDTKLKLLYILDIIKETDENSPITAAKIAEKLEKTYGIQAERKSICRDITVLTEYGYDINICADNKMGFYLGKREFEDWELKLLIDAVWQAKFLTNMNSELLADKLKNLSSTNGKKLLTAITPIKSHLKSENNAVKIYIDLFLNAIKNNRKVKFQYTYTDTEFHKQYRKDGNFYIVNPYSLVWLDDWYYLICNHDAFDNLSYYRLDRIVNPIVLDDAIKPMKDILGPNPDLKIEEFVSKSLYRYSGEKIRLTIRVQSYMMDELTDYFGNNLKAVPVNDLYDVTVQAIKSDGLYYWLLQHGENIEVVSPRDVREEFISKLKNILSHYCRASYSD